MDYRLIGYIGVANNVLVSLITIWRTIRWYVKWDSETWSSYAFRKKLLFHLLLMCTAFCDIPLYFGFIFYNGYTMVAYSFHKLASTFLFAALSITISDWTSVLKDINEYAMHGFLFRRATLISLNAVYITIAVVNFILCLVLQNLDAYLNSPLYTCAIFLQIIMNFLLTTMMLHAGLKLYARIHGAVGNIDQSSYSLGNHNNDKSVHSQPQLQSSMKFRMSDSFSGSITNNPLYHPSTPAVSSSASASFSQSMSQNISPSPHPPASPTRNQDPSRSKSSHSLSRISVAAVDGNLELKNALNNLNLVMATCTVCILLQMIMLTLNYALGYSNKPNKTVGPPLFYWTCSYYIPLWGPILALLYLSRSQSHRKRAKFLSMHRTSDDDGVEGARTSFSPQKLANSRMTPSSNHQLSTDTDDLEAYYLQEQLQSPLIDAANILEYSAGHRSHNLLYTNHLLAADKDAKKVPGKKIKKKKLKHVTLSMGSRHPSTNTNSDQQHPPVDHPPLPKPKKARKKPSKPKNNEVDILTNKHPVHQQQQLHLSTTTTAHSYNNSINPTHVSMSLLSDNSDAVLPPQIHPSVMENHSEDEEEYNNEEGDNYEYESDGEEDGDDYEEEYEDERIYSDDFITNNNNTNFDGRSDTSTVDSNSRYSDSFLQYRDTNISLPSELIFPHNFNFKPPSSAIYATTYNNSMVDSGCPNSNNKKLGSNNNNNISSNQFATTGRVSSANTASIAARLVSRSHIQQQAANNAHSGSEAMGDGHNSGPTPGQLHSYDYSYRGEEDRFDGVFR